jgi:formylglycine-generating enzyme required for sulfatase activity
MMKRTLMITAAAALLCAAGGLAEAQQKYALVIGNADYRNVGDLKNPVNDAEDISAALNTLGFQVEPVRNGSRMAMQDAVERLRTRLADSKGSYGFFYYAGHGAQSNGENYLIPVDADIPRESYLPDRTVSAQVILRELEDAGNALNIVILDACRDNPFGWGRTMRGLAVIGRQPAKSIIVYAAGAGEQAIDGTGRNGLFTGKLLPHLKTPGLDIQDVFKRTGREVEQASDGKQHPAIYSMFYGEVYIAGEAKPHETPVPTPVRAAPAAPKNLRATNIGTDGATVNWEGSGAGVKYRIWWNTRNDAAGAKEVGSGTESLSMRVSGLAEGTAHYFWVSAERDGLSSGKSPVLSVKTAAAAPPEMPMPRNMVRIPAGTFTMGSPANEAGRDSDEVQRQVRISKDFLMGKYEVTQAEWKAVMGSNPSYFKGDNLPVECVSWYDAIEYCNALSKKEGLTPTYTINGTSVTWNKNANGYRLPTEAEWEYACRAGTTTAYYSGSGVDSAGWYGSNSGNKTHPVGEKTANKWGLHDTHGNVWEWCWDWYGDYAKGSQTDPTGASSGSNRVIRGGGWFNIAANARSASRDWITPSSRYDILGFRLVRSAP